MTAPRLRTHARTHTEREASTRERLLTAAAEQFAEYGFRRASVRDICRAAHANVAAVNYHFEGKLGLYREVVRHAIEAMQETTRAIVAPDDALPAEERLRRYVRAYLPIIAARHACKADMRGEWVHRLMRHESSEPTPLAPWIAEQVLAPRVDYLSSIMAELLRARAGDPRVARCVVSVEAQCLFHAPNMLRDFAYRGGPPTAGDIAAVAEHIVKFSLAGVREMTTGCPTAS